MCRFCEIRKALTQGEVFFKMSYIKKAGESAMNLLTVDHITKSYSEKKLFDDASFFMGEGEKIGVIGINGSGKSTLLKIVTGLEETEGGRVIRANHVMMRYLPQEPVFEPEKTVLESVAEEKDVSAARAMLTRLGVTDFDAKCGTLSGGQKKRLALVRVLLTPCDILVLDEPTNHLDQAMADWLEETLKKWKGTLLMVTHDRYFLDSVCSRIVEIDQGKIYSYDTNYEGFVQLKSERAQMTDAAERKRQSILRKELEWVKRGARARSTKQKARLERYEELKNRQAPQTEGDVQMSSVHTRMGRTTVELHHLCKSFGDKTLLEDFSYIFLKGDRIGIIGPNGCGKTTLMKMIQGLCKPDSGEVVIGQTVKIGYFAQEIGEEMKPAQRVIDYIRDVAEYVQTVDGRVSASMMLEQFLFEGSAQYTQLGRLSGGERRRLYLLKVLMEAPNVLILDEPTNDLDIKTLTVLEDYLDSFQGIVITVSHDRYFLDRVVRRIFAFEGGRLKQYEGGYTDYVLRKEMEQPEQDSSIAIKQQTAISGEKPDKPATLAEKKGRVRKLKFTYQEQREYETIEQDITALEEKIAGLEQEILDSAKDYVKLNELTRNKEAIEALLNEKMDRWMYLEDLAARIEQ